MAKLIFGCGYLGRRVAIGWLNDGHEVFAVTRSAQQGEQLQALGIRPVIADLTAPMRLPHGAQLETVLFSVGYDRSTGMTIREVYVRGLQNALGALPESVQCFIYISSAGVFGQTAGEWVDEQAPCEPKRAGGLACLESERLLRDDRMGERSVVLRLGGLYGPGRLPKLAALRAGESLAVSESGFLNLIHVDDAARLVLLAEARAPRPSCYVVSDGAPVVRREFYREAARLLQIAAPRFADPAPGSLAAERSISSKRLDIRRLERDLQPDWLYPTYREGLRSIVDAMRHGESGIPPGEATGRP